MVSSLQSLYAVPKGVSTRWSSGENRLGEKGSGGKAKGGRKGAAWFPMEDGEITDLAHVADGSGVVRRIWITIDPLSVEVLRGVIIRMYWDGSETPAVVAPIADFFCHGPSEMAEFDNALFSSPEGRSFVSFVPMPFRRGMRITAENRSGAPIKHFFYDVDFTIGDELDDDAMYFHAYFNRQNPTQLTEDYEIVPRVTGRGRYLGANLGIVCDTNRYFTSWWGEGEVKIYIDGDDQYPTLCGTGVEDYVSTAWGQGVFWSQFHGSPVYDEERMRIGCYRLHVPDPIYFASSLRVTIQQIGAIDTTDAYFKPLFNFYSESEGYRYPAAHGGYVEPLEFDTSVKLPVLFERADDWSSCAYLYLDMPEGQLETIPFETWIEASHMS